MVLKMMLAFGVLAPIYYVVLYEVVAFSLYPGYDPIARPVSELTATYAPTRPVLVPLLFIFELLMVPFWIGVWRAAQGNRALRLTAGLMLGFRALALLAFPFPMVADEVLGANTIHTIIWGVLTPLLMLASIGASAAAFGKTFRLYAILTLGALIACSVWTGVLAAQINAGEPVRWFGVAERALQGVWLQWVAVLALVLLRAQRTAESRQPEAPEGSSSLVQRHPVLAYYVLTFAISWGGVLLLIGGPGSIPGTPEQIGSLIWWVVLTLELGPPVAGLFLTGLVSGRAGYAELLARLLRWRVGVRWYAVALLAAPLLGTAVLLVLALTSPAYLPGIFTASDKTSLLLPAIVAGLLGGFGEELGWTGFAIPRLRQQHGVLATGLFVGALWGVWHYLVTPAWIAGTYAGELPLALFLTAMGVLAVVGNLTPYRVLMVWVYDRTGSLLVAMLMHTSLIASTLFILAPEALAGSVYVTWSTALAAAFWLAIAAVAVASGRKLSRQPLRARAA
jgi:membrane protease YdiL (CAAX protease family)